MKTVTVHKLRFMKSVNIYPYGQYSYFPIRLWYQRSSKRDQTDRKEVRMQYVWKFLFISLLPPDWSCAALPSLRFLLSSLLTDPVLLCHRFCFFLFYVLSKFTLLLSFLFSVYFNSISYILYSYFLSFLFLLSLWLEIFLLFLFASSLIGNFPSFLFLLPRVRIDILTLGHGLWWVRILAQDL